MSSITKSLADLNETIFDKLSKDNVFNVSSNESLVVKMIIAEIEKCINNIKSSGIKKPLKCDESFKCEDSFENNSTTKCGGHFGDNLSSKSEEPFENNAVSKSKKPFKCDEPSIWSGIFGNNPVTKCGGPFGGEGMFHNC